MQELPGRAGRYVAAVGVYPDGVGGRQPRLKAATAAGCRAGEPRDVLSKWKQQAPQASGLGAPGEMRGKQAPPGCALQGHSDASPSVSGGASGAVRQVREPASPSNKVGPSGWRAGGQGACQAIEPGCTTPEQGIASDAVRREPASPSNKVGPSGWRAWGQGACQALEPGCAPPPAGEGGRQRSWPLDVAKQNL